MDLVVLALAIFTIGFFGVAVLIELIKLIYKRKKENQWQKHQKQ